MIEEIFLQTFGPDLYRQWSAGRLPWTSDQVKQAWSMWGTISGDPKFVRGGPHAGIVH